MANHQVGDTAVFQSAYAGDIRIGLNPNVDTYKAELTTIPGVWITLSITIMRNNAALSIIHLSQAYNSTCTTGSFPIVEHSLRARRSGNRIFTEWEGVPNGHFEIYVDGEFEDVTMDNNYTIKGSGTLIEIREIDIDGNLLSLDSEPVKEMETDFDRVTHRYVPGKGWMAWDELELETLLCTPTRKIWLTHL